jgi:NAD(P)-dependent dehydrogenase (short-subunit alcohol dehydrogenase family)
MTTILVTGSSRGIGRAIAEALRARGARVIGHASGSAGGETIPADLAEPPAPQMLWQEALERAGGRIDVLVNNAGVNVRRAAFDVSEADWDTVLDVNLKGLFFMAQAAGQVMRDQEPQGGAVINISSIMGLGGYWDRVAYCASKAAVINLGRVLALEWGPLNIRVNAVCPAFVITPLTAPLFEQNPDFTEDVMRRTPLGRLPTPEEIAAAVVYLASPGGAAVTGQTLTVDGGWTAH